MDGAFALETMGQLAARVRHAVALHRGGLPAASPAAEQVGPPVLVAGVRTAAGWQVWLSATGPLPLTMAPEAAEALAAELLQMAAVCRGQAW